MLIRTRSLLGRVLLSLPIRLTPYYLFAARIGQDTKSFMQFIWKWEVK